MNQEFMDEWGLISATPNTPYGENNLLYAVEHYFLTRENSDRIRIWAAIEKCRVSDGIFIQHPSGLLRGKDEFLSRDQLIAIFAFCGATGFTYHKRIWKEIKRQWFRYNNVKPPKTWYEKFTNLELIQPGDVIYYGICAGGMWWKLLYPLLIIKQLVTLLTTYKIRPALHERILNTLRGIPYTKVTMIGTDGKLLTFVQAQNMPILYKWYTKIIKKRFGGWNGVFKIFFPYADHPNVVDSANI